MKKRILALTAFMAVALAGCGQINEPLTTTDSNDKPAAKIEIQTEVHTDAATSETITETEKTSTTQQTTVETVTETTSDVSAAETQAEGSTVSAISENNDKPQPQAEEKRSTAESQNSVTTTTSTTQTTTTQAETTSAPAVADNGQAADVFKMLDSLNYHAISCDGLPAHKLTSPDGTVYLLNISGGWVWRRPSLIGDADNEAPLTQEAIDAIYANWDKLNIVKTEW